MSSEGRKRTDDSSRKLETEWSESKMLSKQTPNPEDIYEKHF